MLAEVLRRRFARDEHDEKPDLLLVDGGKGHLAVARGVLSEAGVRVPIVALAKREELVFTDWGDAPLALPRRSPVLRLLQNVRDEAHRFAVGYHRVMRRKRAVGSFLEEIPGVGRERRKRILNYFEDMSELAGADVRDLKNAGIPVSLGPRIIAEAKKRIAKGNTEE